MREKKKAAFHNLGCKVNAYETDAMQQLLEENGYEIVPFAEGADIYIINTCTVTNIADRKSRQMLHRAKKMNPDAIVAAAGCYVQVAEHIDDCIDIVIGNNNKKDIVTLLREYEKSHVREHRIDINRQGIAYESLQISRTAKHTRAYVKIQDGCNQFCSYCIIPYARGRVRSRRREEILAELRQLADNGYQEIVLTGIHISSYGAESGGEESLLSLLCAIHEVDGIQRIRLGSLEPRIITKEFVHALGSLPKVCPHFHLSLQSGCDATLKRMNRRYTARQYEQGCALLREQYVHPAITTDIITGFPGEDEEEFKQTKEFVEKIEFYETHVFKYSKRQGTRAAVMPGQVEEQVKARRSEELLQINERNSRAFREYYVGHKTEVLMEECIRIGGEMYQTGHTKEYVRAALKSEENLSNTMCRGRITGFLKDDLLLME